MRRPGPRWWIAAALVVVAVAAGMGWWYFWSPRTITVSLFPDYAFRQRPEWKALLEARMADVSRIYAGKTAVRWRLASIEPEDPINSRSDPLDVRRTELARDTRYPADLLLIVTGVHEGNRTGAVNPFSHAGLVVDFPDQSEARNTLTMAHELAHLFAAPHEPGSATLMAPEPVDSRFSSRAATLMRRLRRYDFKHGMAALQGSWDGRILDAVAEANRGLHHNALSRAHQTMATAMVIDGCFGPSIKHLEQAVKIEPNPAVRLQLAIALAKDTQTEAATALLREGIRSDPGDVKLHAMLGSLLASRDFEGAIAEYSAAIRLDPKNPDRYDALGALLITGIGRIDSAIAAFQTELRLNPGSPQAVQGLARAQQMKKNAQLEAARRSRIALAAKADSKLYYALGMAELQAGNLDAAARSLTRAIELDPGSGTAYSALSLAHYVRGNYAAALRDAGKSKGLGAPVPNELVAAIQEKMGK